VVVPDLVGRLLGGDQDGPGLQADGRRLSADLGSIRCSSLRKNLCTSR
jgi:hypothetical protein